MNLTSFFHLHLMCISQSSFSISLLWLLQSEMTCASPKWYSWSDCSNFLVSLIYFLAGSILLSYLKGFSQVEFLTDPVGCGVLQLKKQNVTCLSLCGKNFLKKSCVSFVSANSIQLYMIVWNILIIPRLFLGMGNTLH